MKRTFLFLHLLSASVLADERPTNVWIRTGSGSGAWSVGANWSLARPPLTGDVVIIGSNSEMYVDQTFDVHDLIVTNPFANTTTITFVTDGEYVISNSFQQWSGTMNQSNIWLNFHGSKMLFALDRNDRRLIGTSSLTFQGDCLVTNTAIVAQALAADVYLAQTNKTVTFTAPSAVELPYLIARYLKFEGGTVTCLEGARLAVGVFDQLAKPKPSFPSQDQLIDAAAGSIITGRAIFGYQGGLATTQDLSRVAPNATFRCGLLFRSYGTNGLSVVLLTNATLSVSATFAWGGADEGHKGNKLVLNDSFLTAQRILHAGSGPVESKLYASNSVLTAVGGWQYSNPTSQFELVQSTLISRGSLIMPNFSTWQFRDSTLICSNISANGATFGAGSSYVFSNSTTRFWGGNMTITAAGVPFDSVVFGNNNLTRTLTNDFAAQTITHETGTLSARGAPVQAGKLNITGGTVILSNNTSQIFSSLLVGNFACTATGRLTVLNSSLFVTNAGGSAVAEVRTGTITLNAGYTQIDRLVITNACGRFIRSGGTLLLNSPAILAGNFDADADGLPNGWEQTYGLDPFTPSAGDDPDGDGLTNAQELLLGTNPNDNASPYRIVGIVQEADDIRITWETIAGKTNIVQAADGAFSGILTNISPFIIVSGAGVVTTNYLDAGAATNSPGRHYRIRLLP